MDDPRDDGESCAPAHLTDAGFEQLYREHLAEARRLATILVGPDQAEELVSESFAKVLAQVRAGRGPSSNFRAYLHVTIRNGFRDLVRATRETPVSDQPWLLDEEQPPTEELVAELSAGTAVDALATLPESWQKVLWHVEVEGRKPGEVARMMGMRAGAVTSLAHRAREGLRQAYLDQHVVALTAVESCTWTRRRLSQYVRHDLSARAEQKVATHLDGCAECSAAYLQVDRINEKLAAWLFPVVLLGVLPASGKAVAWLAGVVALPVGGSAVPVNTLAGGSGTAATGSAGAGAGSGLAAAATGVALAAAVAVGVVLVQRDEAEPIRSGTAQATPSDPVAEPSPQPQAQPQSRTRLPRPGPPAAAAPEIRPAADVQPDVPAEQETTATESTETPPPPQPPPPPPPPPPPARPIVVQAQAPVATPIQACDTYGALQLPTTRGVDYVRSAGDGQTGPWQVDAKAQKGYVLRTGTTTSFSGNLGSYTPCTSWAAEPVSVTETALATWEVQAVPVVVGGPDRTISVRFDFEPGLVETVSEETGNGWLCTTSDGSHVAVDLLPIGPGVSITCDFAYTGVAPPPATLRTFAPLGSPSGTVTLFSGDLEVGTHPFPSTTP